MPEAPRRDAAARPVVHLIPHTHWDREWYLPRGAFQARLVGAMTDALDRLEGDESLRFLLDGQAIVVEDFLELHPRERNRVERLALTGRLQVGPWYVLADLLIPSGEALIRNLLSGAAVARDLGADPVAVAYAPDAFGHPAVLPTIAAEFGIRHAVVWRGVDVPEGEPGVDLFRWRGPGGAAVLAYHLPRAGYEVGVALPSDPDRLRREWPPLRDELLQRAAGRHVALFVGADHHALRPDLPALRDALGTMDPAVEFRISSLAEYFRGVERDAIRPPTRAGELRRSPAYAWSLQGVHATRLPIKRANSALELLLERDAEPLVAQASRGDTVRPALLRGAWRALLQNQFHDSLAGTVADQAAREMEVRFEHARALATRAAADAMDELAGHDPDGVPDHPVLHLWNPVARSRSAVMIAEVVFPGPRVPVGPPIGAASEAKEPVPAPRLLKLVTDSGEELGAQLLYRRRLLHRSEGRRRYPRLREAELARVAFRTPALPGCNVTRLRISPGECASEGPGVRWAGNTVSNQALSVTVESDGSLTLADRARDLVFRGLLRLRHEPDGGDAYTVHRLTAAPRLVRTGAVRVTGDGGPLVGWVRGEYRLAGAAGWIGVAVLVTLDADSPVARCTISLDNHASDHRLLADVPLGFPGDLKVGTQFGTLERGPEPEGGVGRALERPGPTAPAHRYVACVGDGGGLALFQPGFFEYAWSAEGDLTVTHLRAIGELSRPDLPERPGHAAWPTAIPAAQCAGSHAIRLALMPIDAGYLAPGRLQEAWEEALLPPWARWVESAPLLGGPVPHRLGSITLTGEGLVFSACTPASAGDGVALRCWNDSDAETSGAWILGRPVRGAVLARADESPLEALPLGDGGRRVPIVAGPRALVTVIVT